MSSPKRVLFSISHLASGVTPLLYLLNSNPRVQLLRSEAMFQNYNDLKALTSFSHKTNSAAAIYAFDISYNHQMGSKVVFPHADYLFLIRPPEPSINLLIASKLYSPTTAVNYYCYRLRRMCEIAKRVKSGIILTYDDLISGDHVAPLTTFLRLKEDVIHQADCYERLKPPETNLIPTDLISWAKDCYERHLFFMRSLPLVQISRG